MMAPLYPRTTGPGQQFLQVGPPPIIPIVQRVPSQVAVTREEFNAVASPPVERQATRAGMNQLLPTLFGTDQLGANITAMIVSGNNLLLRCEWCKALAPSTVDGVVSYLVDGKTPPVGATATHYDGSQTTPDATLVAAYAAQGKTYTDTLTGVAYSVVSIPAGTTQGFPRIVAQMRGIKVRATSGGAYAYSDNPVWLVAWLLTERLGSSIDWSSFATAAAVCDALVGSPSEKKYIIGLSMDTEQDVWKWIDIVLGYIRGHRWFDNGLHGLTLETASQTSVMSLGVDMMRNGDIDIQSRNTSGQPTVVRIYYTNMQSTLFAEGYAEASLPGVGTTVPYILSEVRKPAINRHSQANREAIETLNEYHLSDLAGSFVTRDEGMRLLEGDVISISHPRGLSGKQVHVIGNIPVDTGRWRVDWREYDPARYSSVVVTVPTYGDTNLPLPTAPPSVTAPITLTEEAVSVPSGALPLSKVRASWTGVTYPFFQSYKVVITNSAGVVVDEGNTTSTTYLSTALNAFSTYTVSVRVLSSVAQGAAVTGTITLVSLGIDSLATVWSQAISGDLYYLWFLDGIEAYKLWPGDKALRLRTLAAAEHPESAVYTGPDQTTPGRASQLLDDLEFGPFGTTPYSWRAISPVFNIGASRSAVFALYNLVKWINLYDGACECEIRVSEFSGMTPYTTDFGWKSLQTGRYVELTFRPKQRKLTSTTHMKYFWALEFDPGGLAALMPTVTDTFSANSSASAGVTLTLSRKYIVVTSIQITPLSITSAAASYSNLTLSETLDNTMMLHCYDSTGTRIAVPCSIAITGVPAE